MKRALISGGILGVLIGMGIGCGGKAARMNLKSQAFYANAQPTTAPATAPAQAAGWSEGSADAAAGAATPEESAPQSAPDITAGVEQATPAAASDAPKAGVSNGTYMVVGVVVAEANGRAIYAEKVLSKIDGELHAKATDPKQPLSPREFQAYASVLLNKQVEQEIFNELEFAAAQRTNTEEEQQMASGLTAIWRQKEITKACGSLAVARQQWAQPQNGGIDFDDVVLQEYRRNMIAIYYVKHVWPRVAIAADDMRRYYNEHLSDAFTDRASVVFRVIKISVADYGSRERALSKAKDALQRLKGGEDFEQLARSTMNSDRRWARNGGYMDLVEKLEPVDLAVPKDDPRYREVLRPRPREYTKGSLAVKELENALFAAEKGQITDVVESGGDFYIAKVEEKKEGRVMGFEEAQKLIREVMERQQRAELRRKEQMKLMSSAVWRINKAATETAVEMAMQKYAIWKNEGKME